MNGRGRWPSGLRAGLTAFLLAASFATAEGGRPTPAAGWLKGEANPPAGEEGGAGLAEQDRHNRAAGLLRRALQLEAEGKFDEARAVWERLADEPETAMAARQYRIWFLLRRTTGETA